MAAVGLAFLAGILSVLSPCVLPVLPLVLAPARGKGVMALIAGVVISFVGIGLFVATAGFAIGLDGGVFRRVAAIVLVLFGVMLLSARLQARFTTVAEGAVGGVGRLLSRFSPPGSEPGGPGGQFFLGVLLGAVWSPCVGPTLGAASMLAAQGRYLLHVALVMTAFGVGAALPLAGLAALSRAAIARWRGRLLGAAGSGRAALGVVSLALGLLIVTGADRSVETALVNVSPAWLTALTTHF